LLLLTIALVHAEKVYRIITFFCLFVNKVPLQTNGENPLLGLFRLSVLLSAWNVLTPTGWIFMKSYIGGIYFYFFSY
jgi:hypothetical protein